MKFAQHFLRLKVGGTKHHLGDVKVLFLMRVTLLDSRCTARTCFAIIKMRLHHHFGCFSAPSRQIVVWCTVNVAFYFRVFRIYHARVMLLLINAHVRGGSLTCFFIWIYYTFIIGTVLIEIGLSALQNSNVNEAVLRFTVPLIWTRAWELYFVHFDRDLSFIFFGLLQLFVHQDHILTVELGFCHCRCCLCCTILSTHRLDRPCRSFGLLDHHKLLPCPLVRQHGVVRWIIELFLGAGPGRRAFFSLERIAATWWLLVPPTQDLLLQQTGRASTIAEVEGDIGTAIVSLFDRFSALHWTMRNMVEGVRWFLVVPIHSCSQMIELPLVVEVLELLVI